MTTTSTTAEDLRRRAAAAEQEAADSFDRCDTDGFLTQWAHSITARLDRKNADILEAGGVAEMLALFDLAGNWVPAKLIDARYGLCWAIVEDDGAFSGEFVSALPKREATMVRKGYREGHAMFPARAYTDGGTGTGMSGCTSVQVVVRKTCDETTPPVAVVTSNRWADEVAA